MRIPRVVAWWACGLLAAACNSDDGTTSDATLAETRDVATTGADVQSDVPDAVPDDTTAATGADSAPEIDSATETEGDSAPDTEVATEVDSATETEADGLDTSTDGDGDTSDGEGVHAETDSGPDTEPPAFDCNENVGLQPAFATLTGFTGSEDFAFDGHGDRYSIDEEGNLVREHYDGSAELVLPAISAFGAGMAFLPDGDLIIADAEHNTVIRVAVDDEPVTQELLLGGLAYPNGLDVDPDEFVYVAEQNAGRIRRIDARSGDSTIIATGLDNPNGVSFGPGYDRLYVGSFGQGTVTAIDRDLNGDWGPPRLYFTIPAISAAPDIDLCLRASVGSWCYTPSSLGGACETVDGALTCVPGEEPTLAVCSGRNDGDSCRMLIQDKMHNGICSAQDFGMFCYVEEPIDAGCQGKELGDGCFGFIWGSPSVGSCLDAARAPPEWGLPPTGMACINADMWSQRGGLDGLNVDACGTVYVTEFVQGLVWRFDPGAAAAVVAASLPSQWIPNMHWGVSGSWDPMTLYVSDRDQGRIFGLPLGRPGKHTTVSW